MKLKFYNRCRIKKITFKSILLVFILFVGPLMILAQKRKDVQYIPIDKKLDTQWVNSLYEKGEQKVYQGEELTHIAMPCGGIGAGQVEITGKGKLCFYESVYNEWQMANRGHGFTSGYQYLNPLQPDNKIENEFAIYIEEKGKKSQILSLRAKDFDDIQFIGEYPMAQLEYRKTDSELPVKIRSEVFSPFVPLSVRSSANPVVVFKYSVTNTSSSKIDVTIAGWLKNVSFPEASKVQYINSFVKTKDLSAISFGMKPLSDDSLLLKHYQLGGFALSVLDHKAYFSVKSSSISDFLKGIKDKNIISISNEAKGGSIGSSISLKPSETKDVIFLISWYFPNYYELGQWAKPRPGDNKHWEGHLYNNWYKNAFDVAKYIAINIEDLYGQTKLFRDAYYDNTLPYWLANRITMPVSTLAAGNVAIWQNGRMYCYEGVGFCPGTCGHVYNFVTAISKLFPELERSVRLMQDYNENVAFAKSGRINFRGVDNGIKARHAWASDAQNGYVLKAYREHLMSPDNKFLDSVWEKVKLAMAYSIFKDGAEIGMEPNGVLECKQTFWDPMWYGPNPYNNSLYLAALKAAGEMAKIKREIGLSCRYQRLFEKGQQYMNEKMWQGEFYVHLYPNGFKGNVGSWNGHREPEEIEDNAIGYVQAFNQGGLNYLVGGACDANQLFGQNWAHQLGLGYILPPEKCKIAAKNIFKYCWTPDIATVYDYDKPKHRTLAASGEPAMVNAGWPNNNPQPYENTHDKTDIWTGLEYEAACDMINEGFLDEAFIVIRSIHDRYDGVKRNPWNEIEGSDHYSRAMHSWNVLLALSGCTYDGPAGKLGFTPKLNPKNFKSFFSSTEGWGNISQKVENGIQKEMIEVKWGKLRLSDLKFKLINNLEPKNVKVFINGKFVDSDTKVEKGELLVSLQSPQILFKGVNLKVQIK